MPIWRARTFKHPISMWENRREPRPRPQPAGLGLSLKTWRESARRGKSIRSAYFRDPFYYDAANVSHWLNPLAAFLTFPQDTRCYSTTPIVSAAAPWERSFFLGGPGGEAVGCD